MFCVAVSGKLGGFFSFVDKSGIISSFLSVKGYVSSILGKGGEESAHLAYHARTLGSHLSIKSESYLNLITISVSLLKMWECSTSGNSTLIHILVSVP